MADHAYGPWGSNVLDLWLAKTEAAAPLLVFIHGGGFRWGSKTSYSRGLKNACLAAGVHFGAIEYRLSGVAPHPAQMLDCARAIQYFRHQAAEWKIDPERIASTGYSAGAGISLWLAFHDDLADPQAEDPVLRQSTRLRSVVVTAAHCTYDPREIRKIVPGDAYNDPPLKLLHGLPDTFDWNSDPISDELDAALKDCSPINFLTGDDAPVFVLHNAAAEKDGDIHHPNFGKYLEVEMQRLGIECVRRMDTDYGEGISFVDEAMTFMKKHFGMSR